ncbi:Prolyl 4-hydroxylase subunit alpha-1 [Portunus trituberculatus]|uniref:Prolyl 4-hydroxylase subunit alpha-1 n=1 Tax=Portunus trituberculatus TaxID=210409 RepID=A0A5B7EFE3_PORTR|nr:Prolyl 4-hydroxylase subunit alpha-1 [Portunus trituberculatus]
MSRHRLFIFGRKPRRGLKSTEEAEATSVPAVTSGCGSNLVLREERNTVEASAVLFMPLATHILPEKQLKLKHLLAGSMITNWQQRDSRGRGESIHTRYPRQVPLKDQKAVEESKKPALPRQLPTDVTSLPSDHHALGYLCRGHSLRSARQEGRLRCRLSSRGSAWLTLMPVLEEDLSLDPPVVSFHRLLSDAQLTTLKHLGAPILMPATVQGVEGKQIARYRASHTAWLGGGIHPMVRSVNRLAAALTGERD